MARPRRESTGEEHRPRAHRPPGGAARHSRGDGEKRVSRVERSSRTNSASLLSEDSLARLNAANERAVLSEKETHKHAPRVVKKREHQHRRKKKRVVSGPMLEEGRVKGRGGGGKDERKWHPCVLIGAALTVLLLVVMIPVGVLVIGKKHTSNTSGASSSSGGSGTSGSAAAGGTPQPLPKSNTIPASAKGTVLDPFTWYDTIDLNTTYTTDTVGGLSVMGLFSTWDDSNSPNENVPPLNQPFQYGKVPIRGVNIGGWLVLEPFMKPSMFNKYQTTLNVVDEYTLSVHLGTTDAPKTMEKHYATWVTEQTFADAAAAGMDHVRIPYPYWCVTTYPGDPYVPQICWRYLLRGIEWARKHGLRVNLDLHSLPGSQNGWNHSGRQGSIGWLNGTDGSLNAQRSLDIHNQLSTFFAQPRYQNIVTIYGLANEPRMSMLPIQPVLNWTESAYHVVRNNGLKSYIVFGDGFLGLVEWHGKLQGLEGMILDAHQYVIFNTDQIGFSHQNKIQFACSGWGAQMLQSINVATGFGPTMCGEWSQADTDCTQYLNNVNIGSRWEGSMNFGPGSTNSILKPSCPGGQSCECNDANADPSKYSDTYKQWLLMFAEAQIASFEKSWGWFYWSWDTETATQWSWKKGAAAGILPAKAYQRSFNCTEVVPDYAALGLPETY